MDNNFDSVLDMYLFEANSLLDQLDEILLRAEEEQAFNKDCVDEIFRIMHTIKGSSAMMQFNSIMTISHKVEDLFYYIRENEIKSQYNEELVSLVFKFTDFIKAEISKIEEGLPLEENIEPFEKEIFQFLQVISGKKGSGNNEISLKESALTKSEDLEVNNSNKYAIQVFFDDDCGMENLRAYFIVNKLEEMGIEISYEPEDVEINTDSAVEIINNGFYVFFKDNESLNEGINVVRDALNVKNYTVTELDDENAYPKEDKSNKTKIEAKKINDIKNTDMLQKHVKQNLITVNLSKLDNLVDIVGEIVIAESMVISNNNQNSESFTKSSRQLMKLTEELQDIVMSLRMIPVSGIFQKMKRIVRDMGKELNKDVDLYLFGDETEVDKTIVDGIADPIMHLVRNSMDHGIESAEERIKKGKSPKGTIELAASNTGGEIHITVEDDGRGFDTEKILAKAKAKGLLYKPEDEYTTKEIYQILMMPGFSTNEAVTEYSGRGVGMDVVKANVEKVGGTVVLESKKDVGTLITFKIPLTLTIVQGMQIRVGDSELIIPIKNIQQSFKVESKDIVHNTNGQDMIILRDKCYPVLKLHQYFNINTDVTNIEDGIMILVESGGNKICLMADKIVGELQVVVKPMPTVLNKFKLKESGVSGCTILGDGSINLILDIGNIIERM